MSAFGKFKQVGGWVTDLYNQGRRAVGKGALNPTATWADVKSAWRAAGKPRSPLDDMGPQFAKKKPSILDEMFSQPKPAAPVKSGLTPGRALAIGTGTQVAGMGGLAYLGNQRMNALDQHVGDVGAMTAGNTEQLAKVDQDIGELGGLATRNAADLTGLVSRIRPGLMERVKSWYDNTVPWQDSLYEQHQSAKHEQEQQTKRLGEQIHSILFPKQPAYRPDDALSKLSAGPMLSPMRPLAPISSVRGGGVQDNVAPTGTPQFATFSALSPDEGEPPMPPTRTAPRPYTGPPSQYNWNVDGYRFNSLNSPIDAARYDAAWDISRRPVNGLPRPNFTPHTKFPGPVENPLAQAFTNHMSGPYTQQPAAQPPAPAPRPQPSMSVASPTAGQPTGPAPRLPSVMPGVPMSSPVPAAPRAVAPVPAPQQPATPIAKALPSLGTQPIARYAAPGGVPAPAPAVPRAPAPTPVPQQAATPIARAPLSVPRPSVPTTVQTSPRLSDPTRPGKHYTLSPQIAAEQQAAEQAAYDRGQSGQTTGVQMNRGMVANQNQQADLLKGRNDQAAEFLQNGPKYPDQPYQSQLSPLAGSAGHFTSLGNQEAAARQAEAEQYNTAWAKNRAGNAAKVDEAVKANPNAETIRSQLATENGAPATNQDVRKRDAQMEKQYQIYTANSIGNPKRLGYKQWQSAMLSDPDSVPESFGPNPLMERRMQERADRRAAQTQRLGRAPRSKRAYFDTPIHRPLEDQTEKVAYGPLVGKALTGLGYIGKQLGWAGGDIAFNVGPARWSDQAAERALGPADTPNNKAWTDQMNLAHSGLDTVFTGAQLVPNPVIMAGGYLGEYGQKLVRPWINRMGEPIGNAYDARVGKGEFAHRLNWLGDTQRNALQGVDQVTSAPGRLAGRLAAGTLGTVSQVADRPIDAAHRSGWLTNGQRNFLQGANQVVTAPGRLVAGGLRALSGAGNLAIDRYMPNATARAQNTLTPAQHAVEAAKPIPPKASPPPPPRLLARPTQPAAPAGGGTAQSPAAGYMTPAEIATIGTPQYRRR